MYRGEIWWANLPEPLGSEPGYRRPILIWPKPKASGIKTTLKIRVSVIN
ncbi:type II toxin-antitoxin system PemK/MazF family toxin [Nostoc sp. CHAB 5834]|nr:type II toxin-antitoxin system PemK/MazF family toxin [Nostoc sp. CHAB 5834]